ncbi:PEP/pyruvate-binding domain-containing protein [Arenibacter sp. GZD96]|uniref:PEP/pyruvate-binding domain-containing protein n=1 Tax=Aurantibrevibacter litoralis TaxID=3106030 RepID=UPI002AFDF9F7|nr:PEP/pyruvate-binding domain-containing protein [Arenibacter sp. GZD-96]MEA1784745.1 PEP/pyruvate-binding domain-containing protein [Arenibacter sp. GZD-96]
MKKHFLCLGVFLSTCFIIFGQKATNEYIRAQIETFKKDFRGPYKDLRWFCTDGSTRQPKDPCPDAIGPGVQHARYKDAVVALGKSNHIYLGQILAYTTKEEFWDDANHGSRLKQYQLDKYLRSVDNGWILQKGQYYRGSVQVEDEEAWGIDFYKWLLAKDDALEKHYFLIRQSLRDVPHSGEDNLSQRIRSQSKVISDVYAPFMDLRVKIHGQPEHSDIEKVIAFKQSHHSKLDAELLNKIDELVGSMTQFYKPIEINSIQQKTGLVKNTPIGKTIQSFVTKNSSEKKPSILIPETAQLLLALRNALILEKQAAARLQLLDASLNLETIIFKVAPEWKPESLQELLTKIYYLSMATVGAGYVEQWEWDEIKASLQPPTNSEMSLGSLTKFLQHARSLVEWSAAMAKAHYQEIAATYAGFEPLAHGFIDDRIRSSMALYLGESVGVLGDIIAQESSLTNKVFAVPNQSTFRGLNPGYAFGELVVITGSADNIDVASNKIYIFQRAPADLKPVAGIATVSEGNMVSHVQLLARNLGIPNAALSDANLQSLLKYNGTKVFYAVSNKGNVILKPETEMTEEEQNLFAKTQRSEEKIAVPIDEIRLSENNILNLRNVDAKDSGKLCGPKAANLGQLKKMFPDKVVEGLVIPFGVFKAHMEQPMPGQPVSYWEFLTAMFKEADAQRAKNIPESEVEHYQLEKLEILRNAIKKITLSPEFMSALEKGFTDILGDNMGNIPVFLRSDTNMEDLKDFTGAGLNLTIFNAVDKNKIWEGIKDVWASPYTERSFKWRQKYLLNPENVFPSILIIPSVDVDYSGVLITKGISSGVDEDLTVAFSRGAGGAVDGQAAESYLIRMDGSYDLLAPARESLFNSLPTTGGTQKNRATFEHRILTEQNIHDICEFAEIIRETLANATVSDYQGAYDIELGFKDNTLWLFQIRPFVENKRALSSSYLESITPDLDLTKMISLTTKL